MSGIVGLPQVLRRLQDLKDVEEIAVEKNGYAYVLDWATRAFVLADVSIDLSHIADNYIPVVDAAKTLQQSLLQSTTSAVSIYDGATLKTNLPLDGGYYSWGGGHLFSADTSTTWRQAAGILAQFWQTPDASRAGEYKIFCSDYLSGVTSARFRSSGTPHPTIPAICYPESWLYGHVNIDNGLIFNQTPDDDLLPLAPGVLKWNIDHDTLSMGLNSNVTLDLGQELHMPKCKAGEALVDGDVVYISGATGPHAIVSKAKADSFATAWVSGVATESASTNDFVKITTYGAIHNMDTSAFSEGDILYLSETTAGALTTTRPVAPNIASFVGFCTYSHANNGIIIVRPDLINKIQRASDVYIDTLVDGQILKWVSANGRFENADNTPSFTLNENTIPHVESNALVDSSLYWGETAKTLTFANDTSVQERNALIINPYFYETTDASFKSVSLFKATDYNEPTGRDVLGLISNGSFAAVEAYERLAIKNSYGASNYLTFQSSGSVITNGTFKVNGNTILGGLDNAALNINGETNHIVGRRSYDLEIYPYDRVGSDDPTDKIIIRGQEATTNLTPVNTTGGPIELLGGEGAANGNGDGGYIHLRGGPPTGTGARGEIAFGDKSGGNYTKVEDDGTLVFNGDATTWEDANIGGLTLSGPAVSIPDIVEFLDNTGTATGIYTRGFAPGEKGSGVLEIPHSYKNGSDIYFHIHIGGNDAPTGTDKIKFELIYSIVGDDETLPPATTVSVEFDYDTQYERVSHNFPTISGTGISMGDQLAFTITRVAASADEYLGDALLYTTGFHYESDTNGSRQVTTK